MEEAKAKPLSYNPLTKNFIYYDDVAAGKQKIYSLSKLDNDSRKKLSIKRYKASETDSIISTLNGEDYTIKDIVTEIEKETAIGLNFLNLDINYLLYYLSTFPKKVFEE